MWDFLLNFLFPRRCVNCGKIGKYICPKCFSIIQIIEKEVCPVCERPAIGGATHPGCKTKYSLDGLTSLFVYDGPIKKAVKELKYRFVTDLANELVALINLPKGSTLYKVEPYKKAILTAVPLHWWRLNWRGFNQAELLGKMIAGKLGIKFISNMLMRKRATKPQVELKGKERQENIANVFAVSPNILISKYPSILLFDDVWTTGATLRTCGAVLKRAGAKMVWGVTLAR